MLVMRLDVCTTGSRSVYCFTQVRPWDCDVMYANVSICEHGLMSERARRLWMEIACSGHVPLKPPSSLPSKCLSTNRRGRRCARLLDQVLQSRLTNDMKHPCSNDLPRIRLRRKCAERFMYATDAIKHIQATATMDVEPR